MPTDAGATAFVTNKHNNGECDDNEELRSEEVVNLPPTQTETDYSLLREEVESIINSTSPDEINVERVLHSVM
eukprot:1768368-Ditylum_brightwellii.AAC.1